jgi:hypothetical protein
MELLLTIGIGLVVVALVTPMLAMRPALILTAWAVGTTIQGVNLQFSVSVGALNVSFFDGLAMVTVAATAYRWAHSRAPAPTWGFALATGLLALNMLRGFAEHGLGVAVNESRETLTFLSALVYFSTVLVDEAMLGHFVRLWRWVGAAMVVKAAIYVSSNGLSTYGGDVDPNLLDFDDRPLWAAGALLMAQATFVVLLGDRRTGAAKWVPVGVGFTVLVVSGQRTVWAGAALGFVVLLLFSSRGARLGAKLQIRALATLLAALAGTVLVAGYNSFGYAYETAFSDRGTLLWRVDGWEALVGNRLGGPLVDILVGQPAGFGYDRLVNGSLVVVGPHSGYVTPFLTVGAVGLAALLWGYLSKVPPLMRAARSTGPEAQAAVLFIVLIVLDLVLFFSYAGTPGAAVALGLAAGFVAHLRRSPAPVDAPVAVPDDAAVTGA